MADATGRPSSDKIRSWLQSDQTAPEEVKAWLETKQPDERRTHRKPSAIRALALKLLKVQNGDDQQKGKCRVCLKDVEPGRKYYCGHDCARTFQSSGYMTYQEVIALRDGGVCACCGLDTEKLIDDRAEAGAVPSMMSDYLRRLTERAQLLTRQALEAGKAAARQAALEQVLEEWGAPSDRKSLVEVDHIIPVSMWQGDPVEANNPENLQTLAIPCHRKKSKTDGTHRAKARRIRRKEGPKARQLRETREAAHGNAEA